MQLQDDLPGKDLSPSWGRTTSSSLTLQVARKQQRMMMASSSWLRFKQSEGMPARLWAR